MDHDSYQLGLWSRFQDSGVISQSGLTVSIRYKQQQQSASYGAAVTSSRLSNIDLKHIHESSCSQVNAKEYNLALREDHKP